MNVYYGYSAKNDSIKAKEQIEYLKKIALNDIKADKNRCFEAILSYEMQYAKDSLKNTLSDYLRNVEHSQIPWLSVAAAYLLTGDYNSGFDAIGLYDKYNADQNIRYHAILSELHENSGNISDALFHYKQYFLRSDSANVAKLKSDTQFIEERYGLKLENAEKEIIVLSFYRQDFSPYLPKDMLNYYLDEFNSFKDRILIELNFACTDINLSTGKKDIISLNKATMNSFTYQSKIFYSSF